MDRQVSPVALIVAIVAIVVVVGWFGFKQMAAPSYPRSKDTVVGTGSDHAPRTSGQNR